MVPFYPRLPYAQGVPVLQDVAVENSSLAGRVFEWMRCIGRVVPALLEWESPHGQLCLGIRVLWRDL